MEPTTIIALVLLAIIAVLMIWDLIILRHLSKKMNNDDPSVKKEGYFELKYNIRLLQSISVIIITVIGFLGYSTLDDLKAEIKKDLGAQDSSIEAVSNQVNSLNDSIENYWSEIEGLFEISKELDKKIRYINESFKYNPKIYVINNIAYPDGDTLLRLEFKDLETIFKERLPEFKNAPTVLIQGHTMVVSIREISKDHVTIMSEIGFGDLKGRIPSLEGFDILIASFE